MRIAQVAPLIEPVPPPLYGGTERVVSWLTEELVRRGHEVTLFATGDSRTEAALEVIRDRSIRLDPELPDPLAYHVLELGRVFEQADRFDVIHCHVDFLAFPFAQQWKVPTIHTLHGRLDLPHWLPLVERYRETPLVSISDSQRRPLDRLGPNWIATIYHGLPEGAIRPGTGKGGYLAFFSRLSREKRPDIAIEVAKRTGLPLKIAGKVDNIDKAYFEAEIEPLLDHPLVEYLGEMGDEKVEFLGNALCLIFPIDWPEPFGLVMIEAMACGTPVITRPFGSAPEVVHHGRTGFIVDTVEEMVEAVRRVGRINRNHCIETVQERFSAEVMCARYESVYEKVLNGGRNHIL
jgi:glycosyltransferase involved in cell wall biosynthesis